VEIHKQGSYHHGQLRRALLDAALELIEEHGVNGFTLREVARQAGVSHAAPYHHFADKSALVEALAVESFQALASALQEATAIPSTTALEHLMALGRAYVRFALEHPAAFRLMYRPELRTSLASEKEEQIQSLSSIDKAGLEAYQLLIDGIVACQQSGSVASGDPVPLTLTAWCTVHGLATLLLDGSLGSLFREKRDLEHSDQLAKLVTEILIHGLRA